MMIRKLWNKLTSRPNPNKIVLPPKVIKGLEHLLKSARNNERISPNEVEGIQKLCTVLPDLMHTSPLMYAGIVSILTTYLNGGEAQLRSFLEEYAVRELDRLASVLDKTTNSISNDQKSQRSPRL